MAKLRIHPAYKFSMLVFSPLLVALLIPSACLVPSGALLLLIGIFDPLTSLTDSAGYLTWVYAPVLAAAILFLVGVGLHALYLRGMSPKPSGRRYGRFSPSLCSWQPGWHLFIGQHWRLRQTHRPVFQIYRPHRHHICPALPAGCGLMALFCRAKLAEKNLAGR
jgi:hypothetical protein